RSINWLSVHEPIAPQSRRCWISPRAVPETRAGIETSLVSSSFSDSYCRGMGSPFHYFGPKTIFFMVGSTRWRCLGLKPFRLQGLREMAHPGFRRVPSRLVLFDPQAAEGRVAVRGQGDLGRKPPAPDGLLTFLALAFLDEVGLDAELD